MATDIIGLGFLGDDSGEPSVGSAGGHVTDTQQAGTAVPDDVVRRAQQMEAIGRLAGGIAHDFNNLLAAITGYAELVLEEIEAGHPAHADVQEIFDAAERAGTLTRQLLEFSSREPEEPRALDLNRVVSSLDRMLRRLVGDDVELVSLLDGELWPIRGDPGRIEQVLVNLVVNARDAMPRGGRISIATEGRSLSAGVSPEESTIPDGDWVMLTVRDTGIGMDPATLDLAFEPFFTTRGADGGTGLGLSTVSEIVNECGGTIRVNSHPNQGSTFTVFFPRATDAPEARPVGKQLLQYRGSETVLVVEDAAPVRRLVRRFLNRSGYKVLEARTPVDALRFCDRHPGPIHLLLTDLLLPGIDGHLLARRVHKIRPTTRAVYMSGMARSADPLSDSRSEHVTLLRKPFTAHALLNTVRTALDEPAA